MTKKKFNQLCITKENENGTQFVYSGIKEKTLNGFFWNFDTIQPSLPPNFLPNFGKIHGAVFSKSPKNTDFLEILPTFKILHILSKKRLCDDWAPMDAELLKKKLA